MWRRLVPAVAIGWTASCAPLDMLGVEEFVVENERIEPYGAAITDDRIEDKHPVFDPQYVVHETFNGCSVTLNKSGSVTKLDIMPFSSSDNGLGDRLYPTYASAIEAVGSRPMMPSMELTQAWMKPFNDGLYAAVELAANDGSSGSLIDKRLLFESLLQELVARSSSSSVEAVGAKDAAKHVAAALLLGGALLDVPPSVSDEAAALRDQFLGITNEAQPIGFYTWTPELSRIFRQDRYLQGEVLGPSFTGFATAALALRQDADLADRYDRILSLYAGLTNPYYDIPVTEVVPFVSDASSLDSMADIEAAFSQAHPTSTDGACAARLAFLPASDSVETALFRDLLCRKNLALPEGVSLIDVLISKIRSGEVDLTPGPDAGWYDRQTYALETLLVPEKAPEKDHLFLTRRYKEKLIETFKTIITQNRETHAKQLDRSGTVVSAQVPQTEFDIYPQLPVEPFPTFYLRTARAYVFLQGLLRTTMGEDFLANAGRIDASGVRENVPLGEALQDRIRVLYGLHVVAAKSIGMPHQLASEELDAWPLDVVEMRAREFLQTIAEDEDVVQDPRVIVPVHHDKETRRWKYWAVVGAKILKTQTLFYPGFEPVFDVADYHCVFKGFVEHDPYIVIGKMVEVSMSDSAPPLTRDQFRAICDAEGSVDAIVAALEAR